MALFLLGIVVIGAVVTLAEILAAKINKGGD